MRRSFIPMLAAVFAFACSDLPTATQLEPMDASFAREPGGVPEVDNPPPPFAIVTGTGEVASMPYSFTAKFFANKPGNIAWLQFTSIVGESATLSSNARIMIQNGEIKGTGTIRVGGNTIDLRTVNSFNYQTYRTTGFVSFSAPGLTGSTFRSGGECGITSCGAH